MDGPHLVALKCENCGAPLPEGTRQGEYVCEYCHFRSKLVERPSSPPSAPKPAPVEARPVASPSGSRAGAAVSIVVVLGAAVVAWVGMASREHGGSKPTLDTVVHTATPLPSAPAAPLATPAAPPEETLYWDDVGGPPQEVKVGGKTAFLGRIRTAGGADQLQIVLTDSATVQRIWRSQDLGSYSEGYHSTLFAAAGDRVVISDFRSRLHILDLATGQEKQTITMTDRAQQLCPVGDRVWVGQVDKRSLLVDPQTGQTHEARRPASCPEDAGWPEFQEEGSGNPLRVAGMRVARARVEGDVGIAAGVKAPGTRLPMVAGFDPATRSVKWKRPLGSVDQNSVREGSNEHDGLRAGRYVSIYGVGSDLWRLVALDARSGDALWDVPLRDIFAVDSIERFVLGEDYVYVNRTSSLEVFDVRTGKLLGTVGNETYE